MLSGLAGQRGRLILASARLIGRQALTGQALLHGYTTAFWWTAGIFAGGAVICGILIRSGPLAQPGTPSPARDAAPTPAQAETDPGVPARAPGPGGSRRDPGRSGASSPTRQQLRELMTAHPLRAY